MRGSNANYVFHCNIVKPIYLTLNMQNYCQARVQVPLNPQVQLSPSLKKIKMRDLDLGLTLKSHVSPHHISACSFYPTPQPQLLTMKECSREQVLIGVRMITPTHPGGQVDQVDHTFFWDTL